MVELEIFELSIFEEFPEIQKQFHGTQDEDKQEEIRMNLVKERGFISNIIRRYFRWEWMNFFWKSCTETSQLYIM